MTVIVVLICVCLPNFIKIGSRVWPPDAITAECTMRHFKIKKKLICDYVTVIVAITCCCVPNFIKIGSHIRPPDTRNCWMFNVPLPGNGRRHGNHITADMSGTWWDVTTQVSSKSVHWEASYGISNIFQHGGRPPFWIIKILIFDRVTVIVVPVCCSRGLYQISTKLVHAFGIETPITAECTMRRC